MGNGGINDVRRLIKGMGIKSTGAMWRERYFNRISVKTGRMAVRPHGLGRASSGVESNLKSD